MSKSPKIIGVGVCRVCGAGKSLIKTHICPGCASAMPGNPFRINLSGTK